MPLKYFTPTLDKEPKNHLSCTSPRGTNGGKATAKRDLSAFLLMKQKDTEPNDNPV